MLAVSLDRRRCGSAPRLRSGDRRPQHQRRDRSSRRPRKIIGWVVSTRPVPTAVRLTCPAGSSARSRVALQAAGQELGQSGSARPDPHHAGALGDGISLSSASSMPTDSRCSNSRSRSAGSVNSRWSTVSVAMVRTSRSGYRARSDAGFSPRNRISYVARSPSAEGPSPDGSAPGGSIMTRLSSTAVPDGSPDAGDRGARVGIGSAVSTGRGHDLDGRRRIDD
jgi:hypothetical protein